jgi:putative hemolysin
MLDFQGTVARHFPTWFEGRKAKVTVPLVRTLARLSRLDEINAFLADNAHLQGFAFIGAALEHLDCRWLVDNVERERVPERGRVVIIANHPLGAIDALALLAFIGSVRRDVRILANDMLGVFEGLSDLLIPLRVFGGKPATDSLAAVDAALAAEQAVIVFPAGEVARLTARGVADGRWRAGFLRFAEKAGAPVLPVHIRGRNSAAFYGLSALYKPLGTALLPREMFARRGRRIEIRIGMPQPAAELSAAHASREEAVAAMRKVLAAVAKGKDLRRPAQAPVVHSPCLRRIHDELARLERIGETHDGKAIYVGQLCSDSALLMEIARLREITFRAVGEGTGRRLDTDRYDTWYEHIVLWDAAQNEIAGAYRVAHCARVLGARGLNGLYTAALFDYDPRMLPLIERGLELGRSFVQPKYWGTRSLDYLWFGIGAYLRRHPEVRFLFGPVSISAALPQAAREQLVAYYSRYYADGSRLARSRNPFVFSGPRPEFGLLDADQSFEVLRHNLEAMGAKVPILYKQYTELCEPGGANFLAFGVDPDFAGAVDGLIMVDLARLKPRKRARYIDGDCTRRLGRAHTPDIPHDAAAAALTGSVQ